MAQEAKGCATDGGRALTSAAVRVREGRRYMPQDYKRLREYSDHPTCRPCAHVRQELLSAGIQQAGAKGNVPRLKSLKLNTLQPIKLYLANLTFILRAARLDDF